MSGGRGKAPIFFYTTNMELIGKILIVYYLDCIVLYSDGESVINLKKITIIRIKKIKSNIYV